MYIIPLASGRRFYAHTGALSLDDGALQYGSDGSVHDVDFTPEDRREIASHVIAQWEAWAAADAADGTKG